MRECRYQKVLAENEFLNRSALVGRVVNNDVGKDGNTRERNRHVFLVVRLEIEEFPFVADKCKAKRREVSRILVKSLRGQRGEFRLVRDDSLASGGRKFFLNGAARSCRNKLEG